MKRTGIVLVILGTVLGAVIGYSIAQSGLWSLLGALAGGAVILVGIALFVFVPGQRWSEVWLGLTEFSQVTECCASLGIVPLTIIIILVGCLLWHSLLLAALAGISVTTISLMTLSVAARLYAAQ